jgi:hypothetical protein
MLYLPRRNNAGEHPTTRLAAVVLLVVLCLAAPAAAEEPWTATPEQRRERLQNMTAEQKEKLQQQRERFESLSPAEQQQLRDLHRDLSQAPDGAHLFGVLKRYCEWLKSLNTAQRAELESLPEAQRVARIVEILKEQETQRLRNLANLPYSDGQAVLDWLDGMVQPHEDELMSHLSERTQRYLRERIDDPRERRKRMVSWLFHERKGDRLRESVEPTGEDLDRLLAKLSAPTREAFAKLNDPEKQQETVRRWIWGAVFNPAYIAVSDKELNDYFARLPESKQAELERLPREEMHQELRKLYLASRFNRGEWGFGPGGPPLGRPPFRGNRDGGADRFNRPRSDEGQFAKPPGT